VKTQNIAVVNRVGNGVGVQLFFKNIFCCPVRRLSTVDLLIGRVFFKNGCSGKSKKLRFWKKLFDRFMVITKL